MAHKKSRALLCPALLCVWLLMLNVQNVYSPSFAQANGGEGEDAAQADDEERAGLGYGGDRHKVRSAAATVGAAAEVRAARGVVVLDLEPVGADRQRCRVVR